MSELSEDLLAPTLTKKRVIGVIIVAVLLVSLLATSTYFLSLIFDSQRIEPSERVEDAEYDYLQLVLVPPPFDISDLIDDLNLTPFMDQLTEQMLEEMLDGQIDDLDLTNYGLAIAALLASEVELFRVLDYDNPVDSRTDLLWKFETFDQFNGDGWHSTAIKEMDNFYDYSDYNAYQLIYPTSDLIKLKRPLSPNIGVNSFVMASLFSEPFIIKESISAPYLDVDSIFLFKDEFGSTTADLIFNDNPNLNMTYDLYNSILPTNDQVNNSAVRAIYTPTAIKNQFLQLPPSISSYLSINNDFKFHYDILATVINSTQDNAFVIANKIRSYLQSNFAVGFDQLMNDGPADGEDVVEWFCEKREGLWSEFASAFSAFTRAFGVASRFVDGFNSRDITEFFDTVEGKNSYQIKYKNIYNWAEIYVPYDTTGLIGPTHGEWIQMDILYDSFGGGGNPITEYNLTVEPEYTMYNRPDFANITATLSSAVASVDNKQINFYDITMDTPLPSNFTDSNGKTSILININDSSVVGPHIIRASSQFTSNTTEYVVNGDIAVNLINLSPTEVNISEPIHTTNIIGNLTDPVNGRGVSGAIVDFLLFRKGTSTNITNAFNPPSVITDLNGEFDLILNVEQIVQYGEYEVRVDFNGTWIFYPPFLLNNINDSSDRIEFNVTEDLTYNFKLSIDGIPTNHPGPVDPGTLKYFKDGEYINLSVTVKDKYGFTLSGAEAKFYDFTNGDVIIGTDFTDIDGNASILYGVGPSNKSGPTLIYAQVGNKKSYSYYVFNESIIFELDSGPNPREINVDNTNPDTFDIDFRLVDNSGDPVNFSHVNLEMWRGIIDRSNYLDPSYPEFNNIDGSNEFIVSNIGVLSATPVGNYTLKLLFKGVFDYNSYPYPKYFNEGEVLLYSSYDIPNELKVVDPQDVSIIFKIDGNHALDEDDTYNNSNFWNSYYFGQNVTFEVWINQSGDFADAGSIARVIDSYTGIELGSYTFIGTDKGYHKFVINTSVPISMHSGLHFIKITFENPQLLNTLNYTYIYINESFSISALSTDYEVLRNNDMFSISGYAYNGTAMLRGINVTLLILNESLIDVSDNFYIFNSYSITADDGLYSFDVSPKLSCPKGTYFFTVYYDGSLRRLNDPTNILMYNYNFVNVNSSFININVTAGSIINEDSYYTKYGLDSDAEWYVGDTLYVIGNLTWDDGSIYSNMYVNVTVQRPDGTVIAYNYTVKTSVTGYFNATITVLEGAGWPSRITTKIVVYFDPIYNGEDLVERTETTFT